MKLQLPLSADEMQTICDNASPFAIPALIDLVSNCQNILTAVRETAKEAKRESSGNARSAISNIVAMINQIIPE